MTNYSNKHMKNTKMTTESDSVTTKERILDEFDTEALLAIYDVPIPAMATPRLKKFLSQALDQIAEETRKETLEDVMILIERYAKESYEKAIIPDRKVVECECGGHLIEWYSCKKFTGYACDKCFQLKAKFEEVSNSDEVLEPAKR